MKEGDRGREREVDQQKPLVQPLALRTIMC